MSTLDAAELRETAREIHRAFLRRDDDALRLHALVLADMVLAGEDTERPDAAESDLGLAVAAEAAR